eukprot:CAMPEP_0181244130 /NCGR_PEP_ID=MMETSP1096-20121128/42680_1 /TAXON_ID=156174 ORGANISM="Chrysochromulina ericina, Strain CCMP281" /NCGR_SAMPLE_ID=MMETSP1096 /ASSEMBLY_ACC=CAM_ASM_000453 /LENGTH=122 /DNA_ID=CAMNT_0023340627 /DNA_START=209 /DNA_END=577 /DNA_ORIENTATION=+
MNYMLVVPLGNAPEGMEQLPPNATRMQLACNSHTTRAQPACNPPPVRPSGAAHNPRTPLLALVWEAAVGLRDCLNKLAERQTAEKKDLDRPEIDGFLLGGGDATRVHRRDGVDDVRNGQALE